MQSFKFGWARAPTPQSVNLFHSDLPLLYSMIMQGCTVVFVWCPVVTSSLFWCFVSKLLYLIFAGWQCCWFYLTRSLLACRTRGRPEEVLSASMHGFIGCYGDVRRTDLESYCWTDETRAFPQTPLAWHYLFWDQLFYITHDFYVYDLMPLLTTSAHASEWDPTKVFPIGPRTC